jgi:GTPase
MSTFNFDSLIEEKEQIFKFKEEVEEGNIEYKLRLDFKTEASLKKMLNQMNWRFDEGKDLCGKRECHYILGIYDNGKLGKLTDEEIDTTFEVFKTVTEKCDASIKYYEKKNFNDSWIMYISLIQILDKRVTEINVAFVGPPQTGKTTTISNITYGQLDDGNGSSRQHVFRHEHEKLSGYTSSLKKEIIGIKNNNIINYNTGINISWEQIANISDRILCLIDLPGAPQYMKTILFGLSAYNFDAMVIFNDNSSSKDITHLNQLYIEYAKTLNIPYIIVEIYDDISPCMCTPGNFNPNFGATTLETFVPSANKNDNENESLNIQDTIHKISNTKPHGISNIISFLTRIQKQKNYIPNINDNIFVVADTVSIPDTGIVFSGEMWYGQLSIEDQVFLTNGNTTFSLKIKSIHKKQTFTDAIYTNEMGAILLSGTNMDIQKCGKHMIITNQQFQSYTQLAFKTNSSYKFTINTELTIYINNHIIKGFIKDIDEKNNKYSLTLSKNIIIVPRVKNLAFAKIENKIFILDIVL